MNSDQNLIKKLAEEYKMEDELLKLSELDKKKAREALLNAIENYFVQKDHLLPVKTIEIPFEFFSKTGLLERDFLSQRYPDWTLEHTEYKDDSTVFILKKKVSLSDYTVELTGSTTLIKSNMEYTPEIDWDTLKAEFPELYDILADEVVEIKLNEDNLKILSEEDPDLLFKLERHVKVKPSSVKLSLRKNKDA